MGETTGTQTRTTRASWLARNPAIRSTSGTPIPCKESLQTSLIGGGLNFEREQFLKLVDRIVAGEVEKVVLAHQDRLVRFGYKLLAHLCQTHHTELVVMNTETLSPEQELVQDLMAITHCFSSRLDGLRNYRKALNKALADENRAQDPDQSDA